LCGTEVGLCEFNYPPAQDILKAAITKAASEAANEVFSLLHPMLDDVQKGTTEAAKAREIVEGLRALAPGTSENTQAS
jgi:uncharacterized Zn finger protein